MAAILSLQWGQTWKIQSVQKSMDHCTRWWTAGKCCLNLLIRLKILSHGKNGGGGIQIELSSDPNKYVKLIKYIHWAPLVISQTIWPPWVKGHEGWWEVPLVRYNVQLKFSFQFNELISSGMKSYSTPSPPKMREFFEYLKCMYNVLFWTKHMVAFFSLQEHGKTLITTINSGSSV